jgi:thioredoxin reductase (NADPH)
MAEVEKIVILGAGPAGLSAALYAARAELSPLVLTGLQPGGQASTTFMIENYPGFPDGVSGADLADLFQKQAEHFGARIEYDSVTETDFSKRPFRIKTYNREILADSVIISTGASPVKLNVPGEAEFTGRGVSYCATCDGFFFKDKKIAVIGGGDSALEEALFLTRFGSEVIIIHRRDAFRAGALLQKRMKENPKIKPIMDSVVKEIKGNGKVEQVAISNVKTGVNSSLEVDGVFIFIGFSPNNSLYKGQLEMDELGFVKIDEKMQTNVPGVFAAGETADSHFRQVVTSAGMGAAAAIEAAHFLSNKE